MRLPAPSPDALAFSDALKRRIIDAIEGADGWIGFAGWADQGNTNPILRAFIEWCDVLAATKEKEDTQP